MPESVSELNKAEQLETKILYSSASELDEG